jgi:Transposase zinc-binding domain
VLQLQACLQRSRALRPFHPRTSFVAQRRVRPHRTVAHGGQLVRLVPRRAVSESPSRIGAMEGVEFGEGVLKEAFRRGWAEVQPLVPARVRGEVERYLRCGDVRYGFVEARCAKCEVPRLVALRCRGRGWCPSCTTRRALETGLQLEEELLKSLPPAVDVESPARFQVVKKPGLLKRLEVRLVQAVWRRQRATAKRLGTSTKRLRGGGVCFWQYFGSSLQLTPHLHLLVPQALWTPDGEVVTLPPPDDGEVRPVLERANAAGAA